MGVQRPFSAYRLPGGHHGLPAEQVAENQLWRLLGAAAEVFAERGYRHTTSAAIVRSAGVSSTTFYRHFGDVDECLLAAHEMAAECLLELVQHDCAEQGDRDSRLRSVVEGSLAFLDAEPSLAQIVGGMATTGVPVLVPARTGLVERLSLLLREERGPVHGTGRSRSTTADRLLIEGALVLICDQVAGGGPVAADDPARLGKLGLELAGILAYPGI